MRISRTVAAGLLLVLGGCLCAGVLAAQKQPAWKPLWDGKTLQGWHKIGVGDWQIEDGAIVGRKKKSERQFGHLVTDAVFKDFTVRLKFKSVQGNSGFYFRIEEKGGSGVSGFQAEVEPGYSTGGLYETNGRAWVARPSAEVAKKAYKPGQWNEMEVSAHGGDVTVRVNGVVTAELKNDPGRRQGHIALQLHGGNDMLVFFKDIETLQE